MVHSFLLGEHGADDNSCEAAKESTAGPQEKHPAVWCDADDDEAGDLGDGGEDSDGGVVDLPVEAEERHRQEEGDPGYKDHLENTMGELFVLYAYTCGELRELLLIP